MIAGRCLTAAPAYRWPRFGVLSQYAEIVPRQDLTCARASAEHRHQVVLRHLFRADAPPSPESLIRNSQRVRDVRARPDPSDVIVGLVSAFLQLGEGSDC